MKKKIIDLTQRIDQNMTFYPGTKQPRIEQIDQFYKDGCRVREIEFNTHSGTHIDTPAHMLEKGKNLCELNLEHFTGRGLVLDFSNINSPFIQKDNLLPFKSKIEKTDFLLIHTGFGKLWGKKSYLENFPVLSSESADWLVDFELKGFGVDVISVDLKETRDYYIHKALFNKNLIIIENLTNLDKVLNKNFTFQCFPLKISEGDGSPVRALAIVETE